MQLLVLTNQPLLAKGIESVLTPGCGFELQIMRGAFTVEAIQSANPEIVLIDFIPEEVFGFVLELRQRLPQSKVILWVRRISVEVTHQTMRLGVRGIIRTTEDADTLLHCLRAVGSGQGWFDQQSQANFFNARATRLTPRETQLVVLVAQGLKNKEIATVLSISEATVRIYLSALFRKLSIKDRYELAIYGMQNMLGSRTMTEITEAGSKSWEWTPQMHFLGPQKAKPVAPAVARLQTWRGPARVAV